MNGGLKEVLQQAVMEGVLLVAQPAITGKGVLDIEAIRFALVKDRMKAQLKHKEGMFKQIAAQLRDVIMMFTDFDQERFDVGGLWVSRLASFGGTCRGRKNPLPVQQGKEGTVALNNRIVFDPQGQCRLVKKAGREYHRNKLLFADVI